MVPNGEGEVSGRKRRRTLYLVGRSREAPEERRRKGKRREEEDEVKIEY
jgi:hypothetical protein